MANVHQRWDTLMKLLMEKGAQALASLVLPGVQVGKALDKELHVTNLEGDLFLDAWWDQCHITVHFEFQKKLDAIDDNDEQNGNKRRKRRKKKKQKPMDRRMWEYNCAMDMRTGRPVYSVLVYLTPGPNLLGSPYVREVPGTGMGHHFSFLVINLWEVDGERLKHSGFEELLPLLPLTKGGGTRPVVEEMVSELAARDRGDLLELGLFCASLVLKDPVDKHWLREMVHPMQSIIEDSWLYKETIAKGVDQGVQQGLQQLRQMLVRRVHKRFPILAPLAEEQAAPIEDFEVLSQMIDAINDAETVEEARHILEGNLYR
jgi:hypothetical protein